jgi:hypothetical protein
VTAGTVSPATLAAALASAEANHSALLTRARNLAGKPAEHDAWILVGAAHRITARLRHQHATQTKGTP